jgi:hypothetical protein
MTGDAATGMLTLEACAALGRVYALLRQWACEAADRHTAAADGAADSRAQPIHQSRPTRTAQGISVSPAAGTRGREYTTQTNALKGRE